jgi:hypothetical protein
MKKRIAITLLSLIISGCKEKSRVVDNSISYGSNNQNERKEIVSRHVSSEILLGAWFVEMDSNAAFSIFPDSIYYVDNLRSYAYEITADTIKVNFDGWVSKSFILKATKDSLVLMDVEDRSITYLLKHPNQ